MNSSTAWLLMDMRNTAPNFWDSMAMASVETLSDAIQANYPEIDMKDIQVDIIHDALVKGF